MESWRRELRVGTHGVTEWVKPVGIEIERVLLTGKWLQHATAKEEHGGGINGMFVLPPSPVRSEERRVGK